MSQTSMHAGEQPPVLVRQAIGIMTGTSMDGLDAVLIEATGRGLEMTFRVIGQHTCPMPDDISSTAIGIRWDGEDVRPLSIPRAMLEFGELHAAAIKELMCKHQPDRLAVVAAHGQTVAHDPPMSWQLLNPTPIAQVVDCPVVTDLRQLDLARGGEGAPITPIADWLMFRDAHESRMVVNLGGFINVTMLPAGCGPDEVRGGDVCVCNLLLDTIAYDHLGVAFDEDGIHAAQGHIQQSAADDLVSRLEQQSNDHESLNDDSPAIDWAIDQAEAEMSGPDILATAVDAIARHLAARIRQYSPDVVLAAGGSALNKTLLRAIEHHAGVSVRTTNDVGIPVQSREAIAMALLGLLALDGVPITLPAITGCDPSVSARLDGSWLLPRSAAAALSATTTWYAAEANPV